MLPPERRLGRVMELIERGKYFTLHAGRQTGKTTSVHWLTDHYNEGPRFSAVWFDLQTARDVPEPEKAFVPLLTKLDRGVKRALPALAAPSDRVALLSDPSTLILRYLSGLAEHAPKPLVVFFDEADCLVGDAMVSFLTQVRDGYIDRRRTPFPHSVVLVGQRNVRDFVLSQEQRNAVAWLGTASPFNITAEATSIGPFTEPEVGELLAQHTEATGQRFLPEAAAHIYALSSGHPWLVNALADHAVDIEVRDRNIAVTAAHIEAAKETIIQERRTHVDSLIHKLHDPRVRKVVDAMLAGDLLPPGIPSDDVAYTVGLGIIQRVRGEYAIANAIYREVLPRALTWDQQNSIHQPTEWYVRSDGSLDMPKLMAEWQVFWREHGHLSAEGFGYRESGPHLMLMAFLQRIVNGGGRIEREYGLGRGALDLLITWRGEKHAIEVKLRRDTQTEERALEQVARYLDHVGVSEGWLVLFDLRSTLSWDQRLITRTLDVAGKRVIVVGC